VQQRRRAPVSAPRRLIGKAGTLPARSCIIFFPGMHMLAAHSSLLEPAARYRSVRQQTEALCRPLTADDCQIQCVPEVSPPKWHLAHVTWFFETFLVRPYLAGYATPDDRYGRLFNSYYEGVGTPHPRDRRHVLSRPPLEEVYRYRAHVDAAMGKLLDTLSGRHEAAQRIELGLQHEQQHQELILMDVKRNFFANPMHPAYHDAPHPQRAETEPMRWLERAGGVGAIGHEGPGFAFDNEKPRHRVFLEDYRIASRPVTNAEYLEFVNAGGYREPAVWLADGWATVRDRGWCSPLYWRQIDGQWHEMTLHGMHPLMPDAPVCHVSFYEADAYARWREARLPTEAEWETAAAHHAIAGNFSDAGHYQPLPSQAGRAWFGDVWQWTSSPYTPYPGFRPLSGALGEYNGKFMANQYVLRGGSCATPRDHVRLTYRNFYYPHDRWPYAGIRLARDA
jgi:ergothioneine biosynthesis protein EgtB